MMFAYEWMLDIWVLPFHVCNITGLKVPTRFFSLLLVFPFCVGVLLGDPFLRMLEIEV